ncbi:FkbM family methyltransferase [Hyphomonas sp.]|uniref:FkbM family methyltransferase n=1 Tax=Hyphomonas sp. TaxID=87 RepID=UPI001BD0832C|nr:FkbM family methyltransferase [Hyphomonas sp.]
MRLERDSSLDGAIRRIGYKNIAVSSFVNIGAGRGDDLSFFLRHWPGMKSLLIDMDPRFLDGWKSIANKHPGTDYVVCGASSIDGTGQFLKSNDVGGALLSAPVAAGNSVTETPLRRIDTLVAEFNLRPPYFLKFDTHGVEIDILAGAVETLKNTSLIMMEVYNFKLNFVGGRNLTFDEMSLHMKTLGFRCVDMCDPLFRPGDLALWQMHMLFIRDDHPTWKRSSYSA